MSFGGSFLCIYLLRLFVKLYAAQHRVAAGLADHNADTFGLFRVTPVFVELADFFRANDSVGLRFFLVTVGFYIYVKSFDALAVCKIFLQHHARYGTWFFQVYI